MESSNIEGQFVLDSSVIIKWFCEEEHTDLSLKFRESYTLGDLSITLPDLTIYEIGNALRYNKKLTEKDVKESVNSLLSMGIDIVVPVSSVIESAVSLAFKHDITLYDAYFVALAQELDFTFVTADEKLYNKIKSLKFVRLLMDYK